MNKTIGFLTLTALSGYVVFLYLNNQLGFYIHPRYFELSLIAGILTFIVSLFGLIYFSPRELKDFKIRESFFSDPKFFLLLLLPITLFVSSIGFFILAIALLIPFGKGLFDKQVEGSLFLTTLLLGVIIFAIFFPTQVLSSEIFEQRESTLNTSTLELDQSIFDRFGGDTSKYSFREWYASIESTDNIFNLEGSNVNIDGFVFFPEDLNDEYFLLSRFRITCCAVDANPIGIYTKVSDDFDFSEDDWVNVVGNLVIEQVNGQDSLVIEVEEIQNSEIPDNPYIT